MSEFLFEIWEAESLALLDSLCEKTAGEMLDGEVIWVSDDSVICRSCLTEPGVNHMCFVCGWNTGEYPWVRPGAD